MKHPGYCGDGGNVLWAHESVTDWWEVSFGEVEVMLCV
jgi:hypothetical protein